jgi:hypothetical protein
MLKDAEKHHDSKYTILIIDNEWQYSTKMRVPGSRLNIYKN